MDHPAKEVVGRVVQSEWVINEEEAVGTNRPNKRVKIYIGSMPFFYFWSEKKTK